MNRADFLVLSSGEIRYKGENCKRNCIGFECEAWHGGTPQAKEFIPLMLYDGMLPARQIDSAGVVWRGDDETNSAVFDWRNIAV